jgi:hypothetical protein
LDFLTEQEISDVLAELGITSLTNGGDYVLMQMDDVHAVVKHCLDNGGCMPCGGGDDTVCINMTNEAMVQSLVSIIHKIHGGRTLVVPVGKWRSVFDVVAFSMAQDESWQEFDASATIKLNTRDPLLFESGDEHTLVQLITSLMNDGEDIEQGVFLIPVGSPLLIHLQPSGPVKFWFGNSVLADEVQEAYVVH